MRIFTSHCGNYHKMNIALVALTSVYVIGAAVALSSPYWVSSTSMLAPLAAFAATPLGIGVLAFVAVALVGLAISAISKNNKISEVKSPKIVFHNNKQTALLVTKEVYEDIKANNQNKDEKGEVIKDEYRINFSLEGKDYYITGEIGDGKVVFGDTVLLDIDSLAKKNDKGKYVSISDNERFKELGLNKEENKGVNTYLGSLIVEQVASEQKAKN